MTNRATTRQPGEAPVASQPAGFDPVKEAKTLLRSARTAAFATIEAESGHPFASLVTVATAMDGAPLLLLSALSAHATHVGADPRVSLLLSPGGKGDPLAHPRLTVMGRAAKIADASVRRRFLARHPKAALYADFGDFAFYRVEILGGHLNGGFARAAKLSAAELTTALDGAEALRDGEAEAVEHMNADHADAVGLYATALLGREPGPWRIATLDPEGLDLVKGDEAARLDFHGRVEDGGALRAALVDLAEAARQVTG